MSKIFTNIGTRSVSNTGGDVFAKNVSIGGALNISGSTTLQSGDLNILNRYSLKLNDTNGNFSGIRSHPNILSSYTLSLPNSTGLTNQFLKLDASGTAFVWDTLSAGGDVFSTGNSSSILLGGLSLNSTVGIIAGGASTPIITVSASETTVFSIFNVTGATNLQSTLNVTGSTKLFSTLSVVGASLFNENVSIDKSLNISLDTSIGRNLSVAGNVTIVGDFTVNGTTSFINTESLIVEDPIIQLAENNIGDSINVGWIGKYVDGNASNHFAGIVRQYATNNFVLFITKNITEGSLVALDNINDSANYSRGSLVAYNGYFDSFVSTDSLIVANNTTIGGGLYLNGALSTNNISAQNITSTSIIHALNIKATNLTSDGATFTDLVSSNITSTGMIRAVNIKATNLTSDGAAFTDLVSSNITSTGMIRAVNIKATNLTSDGAAFIDLVSSNITSTGMIRAVNIKATNLTSDSAAFTDLVSSNITSTGMIRAVNIRTTNLTSDSALFTDLVSSNITSTGTITANVLSVAGSTRLQNTTVAGTLNVYGATSFLSGVTYNTSTTNSTDYTLVANDYFVQFTNGSDTQVLLPAITAGNGRMFMFSKTSNSTNSVIINSTDSNKIGDVNTTSLKLSAQYDHCMFMSNGQATASGLWYVV
jgi:hypothetical protein